MPVLELKGHTEKVHRCCYVTTGNSSEQLVVSNLMWIGLLLGIFFDNLIIQTANVDMSHQLIWHHQ